MELNTGIYRNVSSYDYGTAIESGEEYLNKTVIADAANMSEPYVPYEERFATYIIPLIFALIFIIGVLGNGCLILIFFRHRAMRNVPNT